MNTTYPQTFPPAYPVGPEFWLMQVPVICTNHFDQADADALYDRKACLMSREDGVSVIISLDAPEEYKISEAGIEVLKKFRALGYRHLRLDPEGIIVAGLAVFEW